VGHAKACRGAAAMRVEPPISSENRESG
jgi:hypothetical protein